jgi:hypothetical protein
MSSVKFEAGKAFTDQALLLNPNFAVGWMLSGLVSVYRGEPDEAIKRLATAVSGAVCCGAYVASWHEPADPDVRSTGAIG